MRSNSTDCKSLPELLDSYNSTLRSVLDNHAPLITKLSRPHKPNPCYTPALHALISARHHLERKYISTHSASNYKILLTATNQYHKLIARAKRQLNTELIQSSILNSRSSGKTNSLLHSKHTTPYCHLQYLNNLLLNLSLHSFPIQFAVFVSKFHLILHQCHLIPTLFLLLVLLSYPPAIY